MRRESHRDHDVSRRSLHRASTRACGLASDPHVGRQEFLHQIETCVGVGWVAQRSVTTRGTNVVGKPSGGFSTGCHYVNDFGNLSDGDSCAAPYLSDKFLSPGE